LHEFLAIQHSDKDPNLFALFREDHGLYIYNKQEGSEHLLATLDNISDFTKPIAIYWHAPYICVAEHRGRNAALVLDNSVARKINSAAVRLLSREDYHAENSSYSIGFVELDGRTLLIHQTEWNRLDISDAETGACLTEREISYEEHKNYIDYFHSQLHISPNGVNFISNGWVWQPADYLYCYNVKEFLESWDKARSSINYYSANWDRPCTFIDDDSFVIATDQKNYEADGADEEDYEILNGAKLAFYRMSDSEPTKRDWKYLPHYKLIHIDLFGGEEAYGKLYYDKQADMLIALGEAGVYAVTLDGEIKWHDPNIKGACQNPVWMKYQKPSWQYSPEHRFFYNYDASGLAIVKLENL
jgi:hypothetical protein